MIDIDKLEELAKAATTGLPGDRIQFSLAVWDPAAILELIAEVRALREENASLVTALADCRDAVFDEEIDNPYLGSAVGEPLEVPAFVAYAFEWIGGKAELSQRDADRYRRLKSFAHPSYNIETISNAGITSLAKGEFITVHAGTWEAMDYVLDGVVTVNTVNIKEPQ